MALKPSAPPVCAGAIASVGFACLLGSALLAAVAPTAVSAQGPARAAVTEEGPRWTDVSAANRQALKPLEAQWGAIGADSKQKWLEIAARFPSMPADERIRIQARMTEWARMTPQERGRVRLNFQEAKQAAPRDRQAQWDAYQALPEEKKRQLAARAAPTDAQRTVPQTDDQPASAKSNIVPNPAHTQTLRQVAPTVVQAQPGATTTLITKRAAPPGHQQTGLPKISATPEFVDRATLLPQRGPQGAAAMSPSAAASRPIAAR